MNVFECRGLTKRYGGVTALDHVDLALERGRIVGLLGPNGSGKTTMIKLASRLLQPTEGELLIDGKRPGKESKAKIAYLPDHAFLPQGMDVRHLLGYYSDFFNDFDREKARDMLATLGIQEKQSLNKLSKGNKEKVQLILTMSRNPLLYILDEPIAGVDPAARDFILRTIIQNYTPDALVLISTHLIADVESVLDEVVFLRQGHIVLHRVADDLRAETGKSVDETFREVFKC